MYELEGLKHKTTKSATEYAKSVSNHTSKNIHCRVNHSKYFRPKQWVITVNILGVMIMYQQKIRVLENQTFIINVKWNTDVQNNLSYWQQPLVFHLHHTSLPLLCSFYLKWQYVLNHITAKERLSEILLTQHSHYNCRQKCNQNLCLHTIIFVFLSGRLKIYHIFMIKYGCNNVRTTYMHVNTTRI